MLRYKQRIPLCWMDDERTDNNNIPLHFLSHPVGTISGNGAGTHAITLKDISIYESAEKEDK
jgi:hypothetical protein